MPVICQNVCMRSRILLIAVSGFAAWQALPAHALMATSSEWRVLARTLLATLQENHEHVIDFIDQTAPRDTPLPVLERVLEAHSDTFRLWAEARRLGRTSPEAMKITENKVADLWLAALPEQVKLAPKKSKERTPPRPRSPSRAPRSRSRGRSTRRKGDRKDGNSAVEKSSGSRGPAGRRSQSRKETRRAAGARAPVAQKTYNGKFICGSYNSGNCDSKSCPQKHVCNFIDPARGAKSTDACALPHRRCDVH
jgi:hypothetical protein